MGFFTRNLRRRITRELSKPLPAVPTEPSWDEPSPEDLEWVEGDQRCWRQYPGGPVYTTPLEFPRTNTPNTWYSETVRYTLPED